MQSAQRVGRIIGLLFLAQVVLATPVYISWLRPVTAPEFLASAAGSASQIRVAVLLSFGLCALTLSIAVVSLPLFRRYSERMAFTLLALSVINMSTLAIESSALRNMLSLSQEYAKAGAPTELLRTLGGMAHSTWYGAHHTNVMFAHATVFVFNGILFRFALVPRALAAVGMAATLLSTAAVTLPLLGIRFIFLLIVPTAVTQLALILWLVVRGFEEPTTSTHGSGG